MANKYITWGDVTARYSSYATSKDANEAESENIPYAENYIEMGLASKFTIPFSSNNTTVKDLCIDAAMGKLLMFKDSEKSEKIFKHIDGVIEKLLNGTFSMVTNSGDLIAQTGEPVYSKTMDYAPIFGHGDIEDFRSDSSQIYDEHIDREY